MKRPNALNLRPPELENNVPINTFKWLFLILSLAVSSLANGDNSADALIENIKKEFLQIAAADIKDYRLCELYSKNEDKKAFVEKTLQKDFTKNMKNIQWKEMQFREETAKSNLHLGVIVIQYMTNQDAINPVTRVQTRPVNYLANSKILTRYIAIRDNENVAFIYSETFIDDKIKALLDKLEKDHRQ